MYNPCIYFRQVFLFSTCRLKRVDGQRPVIIALLICILGECCITRPLAMGKDNQMSICLIIRTDNMIKSIITPRESVIDMIVQYYCCPCFCLRIFYLHKNGIGHLTTLVKSFPFYKNLNKKTDWA